MKPPESDEKADALREADRQARIFAQREFVRPVVLEAGAGTGKTATLVARIVTWCIGPGWERARASCCWAASSSWSSSTTPAPF